MTRIALSALSLCSLIAVACSDSEPTISKEGAAALDGKSDGGDDFCALNDWYGDGECDTFCPRPDPDCSPAASFCGGFGNIACPDGYECVDDPTDSCNLGDGADCGGVCVTGPAPAACGGIGNIACPDGFQCVDAPDDGCELGNGNDCNGICSPVAVACPDPNDPSVHYIGESNLDPRICLAILFACEENQTLFSDECGCGCIDL